MSCIEYCNGCKFCKQILKNSGFYYDTYCTYGKNYDDPVSELKLLQSWSYKDSKVIKPIYCPNNKRKTPPVNYTQWKLIKPTMEWDNIKVGQVYHVPPVNGEKRMDVMVITKSQYMINVRVLKGPSVGSTISFYPESLRTRFFIENKIVQYVSKTM